ncbi:hypothetical protein ACP70R_035088 [Stipagrostis hirtigluma subsp. patula]
MGFESTLLLMEDLMDKSETEISEPVSCDSTVVDEVEKSLGEESSVQIPVENKEELESLHAICDLENNKSDVAEVIFLTGDRVEQLISSEDPHGSPLGCETPRESIFDPFAPGPEEAACAPKKKMIRGVEVASRRQLNFDSGDYPVKRLSFDWSDSEEEDQFVQMIHKMVLDLVISGGSLDRQEEPEKNLIDSSPHADCKTPDSRPLLTGIATTCPNAPLRPSLKALKLSPSICRKINFDSVSDSVSPRS